MSSSPKSSHSTFWLEVCRWIIVAVGAVILGVAVTQQARIGFSPEIILLAIITFVISAKVNVKITRFNSTVTVADAFIFIALLTWGTQTAILVAIAESIGSTSQLSKRYKTFFVNIAMGIIASFVTGSVMTSVFGDATKLTVSAMPITFFSAICLMGATQYVSVLTMLMVLQLFRLSFNDFKTWLVQFYLWSCFSFFAAALMAGYVTKLIGNFSILVLLVVIPIIALLYLTYRTYLRNLDKLQESEARFRGSFDYSTIGMALVSPEGNWLQVNQSLCRLLNRSESYLLKSKYDQVIHDADSMSFDSKVIGLLANEFPAFQTELRLVNVDDTEIWALLSVSTARDVNGNIKHLIFQTQDITSRKKAENELLYKASHDSLTGLCNRSAFTTLLEKALKREKQKESGLLVVLFLDLDGFKLVNDSLGHVIGDELLKGTAERLLECVRGIDTVARMGGDEFTILLENLQDVAQGVRVAERIKQRLGDPFFFGGQEIFIGTSIGIATSLIKYSEPGEILRDADAAMYQAKARGKSCHVVFDYEMHANAMRQLRLANDLRRAIERHEFEVNFQLIQSLETDELCGFESLVRWNHPFYGLLMPSEFVPLAEENGLINSIDNWMLTKSCVQMREWHEIFPASKKMVISVNISTKQFAQTGLVEHVKRVLEQSGLPAKNLQLEITESAMMKNLKNTAKVLRELCALGVRIALDDFGTGYSSLSYLHELPISTLKIDRSFVQQLNAKADRAEIVRAIVTLARSLKMNVVAEGIETEEQLEHLRQMGCNFGQGYLFSRPVSNAQASKIVQDSFAQQIEIPIAKATTLRLVS